MPRMIESTILKPHLHTDGRVVQVGETVWNDEARHRALARKGFVSLSGDEDPEPVEAKPDGVVHASFKPKREKLTGPKPAQKKAEPAEPADQGGAAKGE